MFGYLTLIAIQGR